MHELEGFPWRWMHFLNCLLKSTIVLCLLVGSNNMVLQIHSVHKENKYVSVIGDNRYLTLFIVSGTKHSHLIQWHCLLPQELSPGHISLTLHHHWRSLQVQLPHQTPPTILFILSVLSLNFVAMATRVSRSRIWLTPFNSKTPKSHVWCKNISDISYESRVNEL